MTQVLKQSTAVDVLIGPFVDLTDGATAETGESPSVKLSKNGQTLGAKNDATTPVHDADGYYNCELDATDTNTVGTLVLTVAASANALPVRHEFQVVEEATYDWMFASGATPIADISDGVWDEAVSAHQTTGTFGAPYISASDRISAQVNGMGANIIGAGQIAANAIGASELADDALAAINAEVVDALNVDTYAEPGQGAPAATASLAAKIGYLYKSWRNKKEQTATTMSLYDDAGTTVDQKSTVSDDGTTATRGEIASGP